MRAGLKLAIYGDFGNFTLRRLAGQPSNYLKQDAELFAKWKVDGLKFDGCYAKIEDMAAGYVAMGRHLNATGRRVQYSCSWPAYDPHANFTVLARHCNLWRVYADIADSWRSVLGVFDYYRNASAHIQPVAAPGAWNDPDMLIVGDFGLSYEQSRAQMAMWAVLAAPLYMSNDLRNIRPEFREILLNRKVLAVNQDVLGMQGKPVGQVQLPARKALHLERPRVEVWSRPISPPGSQAVVILNRDDNGGPVKLSIALKQLGLLDSGGYEVEEIFTNRYYGFMSPDDTFSCRVNPTGVIMITAIAQHHEKQARVLRARPPVRLTQI
ncbi:PREDICTED: alpha-N-acetylgalactosaminidase-like [Priapulus caudatus]|uniref:Alpha-galactosidase n=1 Tax=Priapulus caudatus TaxID=37621 RepID=A0ABM1FAV9_PRICU|nr:PREDICTED: alpha-N-acetylgalactosaminidase-like [Priapulus caudatus]